MSGVVTVAAGESLLAPSPAMPALLSISNVAGHLVAGCVGNGSMLARGGSLMERLWIREARRAARRATAPFARQVALGCGAAAVGTMAASLLPRNGMALWRRQCGPLCGQ